MMLDSRDIGEIRKDGLEMGLRIDDGAGDTIQQPALEPPNELEDLEVCGSEGVPETEAIGAVLGDEVVEMVESRRQLLLCEHLAQLETLLGIVLVHAGHDHADVVLEDGEVFVDEGLVERMVGGEAGEMTDIFENGIALAERLVIHHQDGDHSTVDRSFDSGPFLESDGLFFIGNLADGQGEADTHGTAMDWEINQL